MPLHSIFGIVSRRWLIAVSAFLFASLTLVSPSFAADPDITPQDWTMFRYSPSLNAVVDPDLFFETNWTLDTKGGFSSSPTLTHGVIFAACNDNVLYAVDVITGKPRWTASASNMLMTQPLVWHGNVIVGEGGADQIDWQPGRYFAIGAGSNALYGYDEGKGTVGWRLGITGTGMPTGIITNGILYHHDGSGLMVAVDAKTGAFLWRRDFQSGAAMSAITQVSATEFVTAGNEPNDVIAFRPSDGSVLWRHHLPRIAGGVADGPLATDGQRIYGQYLMPLNADEQVREGVNAEQRVYALDAKSGKALWEVVVAHGSTPTRNEAAIPMIHGDAMFIGSAVSNGIQSLDKATGRINWVTRVNGTVRGGVVATLGHVYFGDSSGTLWSLAEHTGDEIGHVAMPDKFGVGSPLVFGRTLIIGSAGNHLYARPLAFIDRSGQGL